ncbi:hypothetical protein DF268_05220 [Streptomyces sp. V2]|uniref:hypothetical protein n=1 Tax=Streptomyces sp. V2 TaxID=1424099 RepID=UPI000D66A7D2|nr:hypothetical protein [Streptomyces sp. V2]PWG14683.1 hypothetical protein DF268_05220 [Streptomyces sp. V2]
MTGSEPPPEVPPPANGSPFLEDVIAGVAPDADHADPVRRRRRLVVGLGWSALAAMLTLFTAKGCDWLTAEHDARVADEAEDKADRQGPAFSVSVRPDTEYAEAMLFSTPFSAEDKAELLRTQKGQGTVEPFLDSPLTPFLKAHHGRGAFFGDRGLAKHGSNPDYTYAEAWLVDILSDRQASLSITGLRVKGLSCTPAKARNVIEIEEQAGGSYEGVFFDLTRSPATALITGEEGNYGEPFFSRRKIDLGNGAAPMGLRVQVTSGTKDCTWKAFEATYVDSTGRHTQDITNNGEDFHVHGIAAPPEGIFEVSSSGPFVKECRILAGGRYHCPVPE